MPSLTSQINNNTKSTCKVLDMMALRSGQYTYASNHRCILTNSHSESLSLEPRHGELSPPGTEGGTNGKISRLGSDDATRTCSACASRANPAVYKSSKRNSCSSHGNTNSDLDMQRTVNAFKMLLGVTVNSGQRGASTVAIDNKIEQAMDLVKSHLMFAVREEVLVLKEQIKELLEKNSQLEYENNVLRAGASPETLAKLSQATNTGSSQTSTS